MMSIRETTILKGVAILYFEWIWLVYFFQEWKKTKFIEKNFETLCSLLDYFDSFYSFRM